MPTGGQGRGRMSGLFPCCINWHQNWFGNRTQAAILQQLYWNSDYVNVGDVIRTFADDIINGSIDSEEGGLSLRTILMYW